MRHSPMSAAKDNNIRQLKRHIKAKHDLNARDASGYTALMLAAQQGHAESVFLLLSAGADPTLTVQLEDSGRRATALALLILFCLNPNKKAPCILFFWLHQAKTDIYEEESQFYSQVRVYRMTQEINRTISYYQNNSEKIADTINKMPTLPVGL